MDHQNPTPPGGSVTTQTTLQPSENPSQPPPPPLPQPQSQPPPTSSITTSSTPVPLLPPPNPNPVGNQNPSPSPNPIPTQNPNPTPKPTTPLPSLQSPQQHPQSLTTPAQTRPPATLPRAPWQQSHFSHFSSAPSSSSSSSSSSASSTGPPSSSSVSTSTTAPAPPRGGIALGVPAHHPSPSPPQPAPFSSSYGQHFGGLSRGGVNLPEPSSTSNALQVKPPMQGMQGMGMLGSINSSSQTRPVGIPAYNQQRPVQSSLRPQSNPNTQPPPQNFQGHGLLRASSVGSPGSSSPSTSQSMQSLNQPWLSSGSQGKPPLPSPSYRQQVNSQSLQQRSHLPQQHSLPGASQQQHMTASQQQQPSTANQTHEHFGQQVSSSRPQALSHQQQISRVQGSVTQKSSSLATVQAGTAQSGSQNRTAVKEVDETSNRILSKRSIHELVNQVDPSERLDPEVEDILMDIADDFVESITTFGCSLAKHRKSTMLEAKDILLHLDRNWNINLPGFGGDEIKTYRKPIMNDIHKERLAAIKKSMAVTETAHTRNSTGQATGNAKGSLAKNPASVLGSPNVKS